jgi:hypothetical protein
MFDNWSVDPLANLWKLKQVDLNFWFQVNIYEALSNLNNKKNPFCFNLASHNT